MATLGELPNTAITLVLVAVIFVAGFLVLTGLDTSTQCTTDGYVVNGTFCQSPTSTAATEGFSHAYNSSGLVQEGMGNVTSYAGTWGTIIGVAVLLGIVLAGFAFGRKRGML